MKISVGEKMKKSSVPLIGILLIGIIVSSFPSVQSYTIQSTTSSIDENLIISKLIDSCSNIYVGEVTSLTSKWENSSKQHIIVSTAEIKIQKTEKSSNNYTDRVTFFYDGGSVGKITQRQMTNPYGELSCHIGDVVKVYLVSNNKSLQAVHIEILTTMISGSKSSEYVYEEQGCNFEYLNTKWDSGDFPVTYRVNENCGDMTGEADEVDDAFETWENHVYSDIDFTDGGSCTTTSYSQNNYNDVFWVASLPGDGIGRCTTWDTAGEIYEFDIELNDNYTWCNGYVTDELDVQNIVTHEVGHSVGLRDLSDSSNSELTMFSVSNTHEIKKRTLNTGDMWGAQHIYPETSAASITINQPGISVSPNTQVTVEASVSSSYTISEVKFKAADEDDFDYDSGWVSMSLDGSVYSGTWTTPSTLGDYYITIRVYDNQGIYTFKSKITEVAQI